MQKDRSKYSDSQIFTFTNSIKTSQKATPEASSNVSFLNGFNSSIKTFNTQPYQLLKDSSFQMLFSTHNKENQRQKRINGSGSKDKWKYMTNPRPDSQSSSKKIINRNNSKVALKQRKTSPLNIRIDLRTSIKNQEAKPLNFQESSKNLSSTFKKQKTAPKEQNIKVYIRLKPKTIKEQLQKNVVNIINQKTLKIEDNYFCFDEVFNQNMNQQQIFNEVGQQMCKRLFQGFNGTIFAYGQTGSGKTFTIFGEQFQQNHGLIYRSIKQILNIKQKEGANVKIKCSMVQLYKEQLIDMFGGTADLKLKESKNGQVYIEGLRQMPVRKEQEMMNLVRNASKSRKVTATKMNEQSSRSHTILTIYLDFQKYTTKLCLIDLAGSEKVCKSGAKGQAFQQTKKINYSLSCLGNVINALTTRGKTDHIPFRDSKLTRLLKDSLTGNFITSIIVNCSLSQQSVNQTISSLKFAERAKKIKINVQSLEEELMQKESISHLHSVIRKLQQDLQHTNKQLKKYKQAERSVHKQKEQLKKSSNFSKSKPIYIQQCPPPKVVQQFKDQDCNISQSQLTARYPIPSQRAYVAENIKRYINQMVPAKQYQNFNNSININEISSLNVSKSIKKFDNSPQLSSLQLKNDESPDLSLSFSIHGQSGHKQLFHNSPL